LRSDVLLVIISFTTQSVNHEYSSERGLTCINRFDPYLKASEFVVGLHIEFVILLRTQQGGAELTQKSGRVP